MHVDRMYTFQVFFLGEDTNRALLPIFFQGMILGGSEVTAPSAAVTNSVDSSDGGAIQGIGSSRFLLEAVMHRGNSYRVAQNTIMNGKLMVNEL